MFWMGSEARKEVSIAAGISSSPERPYVKGGNGGNERAFVVAAPGEEGERVAAQNEVELAAARDSKRMNRGGCGLENGLSDLENG